MFVSKRLLILPLGLMIVLPGCSSSRMRQIFAPDREFMSLSELEEYDARKRALANGESPSSSDGILAAFSKDDDGDDQGVLNVSRWLSSKQNEPIPPDPFLDSAGVAEGNVNEDAAVTVGLSRELPEVEEAAITSPAETTELPILDEESLADSELAATDVTRSSEDDGRLTFADIMAEMDFEDEAIDSESEQDEVELMEQKWLAMESKQSDSSSDEESAVGDFDALLAESIHDEPLPETETSTLEDDIETSTEPQISHDDVPYLTTSEDESETATVLIANDDAVAPADSDEAGEDSDIESALLDVLQLPADDVPEISSAVGDSLWQESDSTLSLPLSGSNLDEEKTETEPALVGDVQFGNWDFGPTSAGPNTEIRLPASDPMPQAADASAVTSRPSGVAPLSTPPVFRDDEFLQDFSTQAAAPAPVAPATAPTAPGITIRASGSPRTWLLLLGGVVIAYLVFSPERQNLRDPNS